MKKQEFYLMKSRLSSSTIQVHAVGLSSEENNDRLFDEHRLILGDYSSITFPVVFQQEDGTEFSDILDTGWAGLYLISDKMKSVLECHDLTGWKTFTVKIQDKRGNEIGGYNGFSVTGRCGPIDYGRSEIIEKRRVPNGPVVKFYKGLDIGIDKWDGKDFFLPEGYFGIIVKKSVAELVKKESLTNIIFKKISEIEVDCAAIG